MAMLEVKDLQVYYGMIQALKGDLLRCKRGRSYCSDRCQRCRKDNHSAYHYRTVYAQKQDRSFMRERILQRFRHTRS